MPSYSIISGSYDGCVRVYDLRMGRMTIDVLGFPVTSVRDSADGNALLASTLDGRIRLLDRADGSLLKAFGGGGGNEEGGGGGGEGSYTPKGKGGKSIPKYRNTEMRIRSVFAKGDAVVLSGSEGVIAGGGDDSISRQAHVFAWDVLSGEVIARVAAGEGVKVVSCVAWNEKGGCWAGGCSDGMLERMI